MWRILIDRLRTMVGCRVLVLSMVLYRDVWRGCVQDRRGTMQRYVQLLRMHNSEETHRKHERAGLYVGQ